MSPTASPPATTERIDDRAVTRANRLVYNAKTVENYNQNESIFNAEQRKRLSRILGILKVRTSGDRFLDVGCGTGNLLELAREIFPTCYGVDPAQKLLAQAGTQHDRKWRVAATAQELPFADASFDVIGMYALLHHLYDPTLALREAHRVLRPGGYLYTDHDPNRYFGRFYQMLKRALGRERNEFGTELENLAEYHHSFTDGLDPEALSDSLKEIGFKKVEAVYRHSTNPKLRGLQFLVHRMLQLWCNVSPTRSFYTHFMLFAQK